MESSAPVAEPLETAAATEPPEAGSPAPETPTPPAPEAPVRWRDIASKLGEAADAPPAAPETPPAPTTEAKPTEAGTPAPPTGKPGEPPKSEAPPKPTGEGKPRFELVGADGKPVEVALPEGAKFRFRADGKDVEVAKLDDLVQMAQQGVNAQRVRSEFGQVQRQLASTIAERDDFRGRIETAESRAEAAEDVLYQILSDPDKYDQVVQEMAGKLSPEARENARLKAEAARREAAEQRTAQQAQQVGYQEFLDAAHQTAVDAITGETAAQYPFLTDADAGEAVDLFLGLYRQTLAELEQQYRPAQARLGLSDQDFAAAIQRDAQNVLTTENLHLVLGKLNARYETRLKPHLARREADTAAAEATRHNAQTTARLARAEESKTLRRTGAPPATGSPTEEGAAKPRNFREHMAAIRSELSKVAE
ncbi:MAG: hypothetical protein AB7N73_14475 [Gemmatimonadales bacterium]